MSVGELKIGSYVSWRKKWIIVGLLDCLRIEINFNFDKNSF